VRTRLPNIHEFTNRHGQKQIYFGRKGQPKIRLRGQPGTPEFMEAYYAAVAGSPLPREPIGAGRSKAGTVSAVISVYYTDTSFTNLAPTTQKMLRAILERIRAGWGAVPIDQVTAGAIRDALNTKKPFARRNWKKAIRGLMNFAVATGLRSDNPTDAIKLGKLPAHKHHSWTEAEIEQFEARHPKGTRALLAMALMLYTAQRRSDAIRLGPQDISPEGRWVLTQKKTTTALQLKVHPELLDIIATSAAVIGKWRYLVNRDGQQFSDAGFGNLFRQWCDEAGLRQCSAHGLRHAAMRRLAEAGYSATDIMAVSGHKRLADVQVYIDAADQVRRADRAIEGLGRPRKGTV
jgi:integrase